MKKKVLITGATGYIGSHVARHMLESGWQVGIIARPSSNFSLLDGIIDKIKIFCYNSDIDAMIDFMSNFQPDVVVHLAAAVIANPSPKDIRTIVRSNLEFGAELLEAMNQSGVKAMVNTGTYWQNYNSEEYNPVDFYASTKEAFEKIIQYFVDAKNFRVITLRLFDVYGEDDSRPKIWNKLRNCALTGETIEMSPGEQEIDLVHIDDVSIAYERACTMLLSSIEKYAMYGVSSGTLVTLRRAVDVMSEELKCTINPLWGNRPYRDREVMHPIRSYPKLPNWEAIVSLKMGFMRFNES